MAFDLPIGWNCFCPDLVNSSPLSIEDKVPDHSAFSRARNERFRASDIFRSVFERVVGACIRAGLVGGEGFAVDAVPEIGASRMGTVHMNDTPAPIVVTDGSIAGPTRSLWQTDIVGIKLRSDFSKCSSGGQLRGL